MLETQRMTTVHPEDEEEGRGTTMFRPQDVEGRISFHRPLMTQLHSNQPAEASVKPSPPRSPCQIFQTGSWEYRVARLTQRVREIRCLLHEDLQELVEPLSTLTDEKSTSEQQERRRALEKDYQQAAQGIDLALLRLLRHFFTEIPILQQAGFFAELDMVYPLPPSLSATSQQEQQAVVPCQEAPT